jgi:methylated-DNA-[protein]-cysteine S-methyltransferase
MTDEPLPRNLVLAHLPTPIGDTVVVCDEDSRLRALHWGDHEDHIRRQMARHYPGITLEEGSAPQALAAAIADYFAGDLAALGRIDWRVSGGTAFQRDVWRSLATIPAGETTTYGALAAQIGRPQAVRAIGMANGANPIGLVLPCHRVIGSDGTLTGYGGGLERKRWLLEHEGALPAM